jgi:hypothetical protein
MPAYDAGTRLEGAMHADPLFHYKELLTNTLDLLSFCLVTPELLLVVRPAVKGLVFRAVFFSVCLVFSAMLMALVIWGKNYTGTTLAIVLGVAWCIVGPAIIAYLMKKYEKPVNDYSTRVAEKSLYIGVGLFGLSRLIGFAYSIYAMRSAA